MPKRDFFYIRMPKELADQIRRLAESKGLTYQDFFFQLAVAELKEATDERG